MGTKIFLLLRVIAVNRPNQPPIEVSQLQTVKWADLTAPDDTKILRDLVHQAMELNSSEKDPILVHCSAGVGRTGTFIGLFKLVKDFEDDTVRSLGQTSYYLCPLYLRSLSWIRSRQS